jgi:actin related protein 2/3 complex subunit 1A/1B
MYVCAVHWHPTTGKIVSASYDRNIFVWTFDTNNNQWNHDVVNLNQTRGILDVKWSHRGDKFVCSTGSNLAGVGYYSIENNWWEVKTMKGKINL